MTAPRYTTDLTELNNAEIDTSWAEYTSLSYDGQGTIDGGDGDYPYIQGSYAVTQICTKDATIGSIGYNNTTATGGHGTDGAYFVWQTYAVNSNVDNYTNGGFRIVVGNSYTSFKSWDVGGLDKAPYPYGGWICSVVNTTVTADDTTATAPNTSEIVIGSAVNVATGSSKGEPHCVDIIRYGRGSAVFEHGDATNGYADFAGFAANNDTQANRWGLLSETSGGYLWQGKLQLGSSGNAVTFNDSDVTVFVKWTPKVTSNFNTIDVTNASSNITMDGCTFTCLDTTTASRGRWITTNDADVTLTSCAFNDMSTFDFAANTVATSCSWKGCDQIDPNAGDISAAIITAPIVATSAGAIYWNTSGDPNTKLDGTTITKGSNEHHAIEFGTTAPTTMNLTDMTFSGFNASNNANNSVLLFPDKGTNTTWTVSHTGTTGTVSYKQTRVGDTVVISSSVPVTITVKDTDGNLVSTAQVGIWKTSDYGSTGYAIGDAIMNEDTVSGVATENYTGSTPVEVEVRVRKASSGATKYKNYSSKQTIGTGGLTLSVTLVEDPNNNATT